MLLKQRSLDQCALKVDVFFWRLAGWSAPTGLAIVHWIGCINAIKKRCYDVTMSRQEESMMCHLSTSYTLQFTRYSPDKILRVKVTTAKSKANSRSHQDAAPLTSLHTKYQLPTLYGS